MATFTLDTGTVPDGTPFPSTVQGFLELLKSYVEVTGLGESEEGNLLAGILQQSSEPAVGQSNMLWVQTTGNEGRPAALNAYQSNGWKPLSTITSGTTDARDPETMTPMLGEFYYDTDISCLLVYSASGWSTAEGSIGDIKFSHASDEATVLTRNPGWEIYTAAQGKSLVAVDPLDTEDISGNEVYKSSGNSLGAKDHMLVADDLPLHTHILDESGKPAVFWDAFVQEAGGDDNNTKGFAGAGTPQAEFPKTSATTGNNHMTGAQTALETRPPLITAFCLKKEF